MKRLPQGFTLIELMIVVAIVAILAAIALPAYQDYTRRAQISELTLAADGCKNSVAEYWQSQSGFPQTFEASGCSDQSTKYVESLTVKNDGSIIVVAKVGPGAIDAAAAGNFALEPSVTGTGHLNWNCKGAGTTIPKKYLPAPCR